MKFLQGDSTIKRMADTLGLLWITFRRMNRYTQTTKLSVVGVPWYDADEWEKTKKICDDPESFHDSYLQWLSYADKATVSLLRRDEPFERVKIVAQDYSKWCEKHKIRKNRRSRTKYVQILLRQKIDI